MAWKLVMPILFACAAVGCGGGQGEQPPATVEVPSGPAADLLTAGELVGNPLRVVWVASEDGTDWAAKGDRLVLMGFDSEDGEGVRVLHEGFGSYRKPLFSPEGSQVAFSRNDGGMIRLLDWETGGIRELGPGTAVEFWRDPDDGRLFLYFAEGEDTYRGDYRSVGRFPLDSPDQRETVYAGPVSGNNFDVSREGDFAVSLFPWPKAGILDLESGEIERFGKGCWTSLAPDGSGRAWVFDGSHKWINLRLPGEGIRRIDLNGMPGMGKESVYYPRWSNHPRILVLSAPFQRPDSGASDVYLGRFDRDFTGIEAWARISDGGKGDFYPDAWIGGEGKTGEATGDSPGKRPGGMREAADGSVPIKVSAELLAKTPTPDPDDIAPYPRALAAYVYRVDSSGDPSVQPGDEIVVGHWVIEDGRRIRDFRRQIGQTFELNLVPYEGNPDYEGERLVMTVPDEGRQLFVDETR
jgi:hypothetical protein